MESHDWIRGITYSILASIIGGASKLSIRKSWLLDADRKRLEESNALHHDLGHAFDIDGHCDDHGHDETVPAAAAASGGRGMEVGMGYDAMRSTSGDVVSHQDSTSSASYDGNLHRTYDSDNDAAMEYTNLAPLEVTASSSRSRTKSFLPRRRHHQPTSSTTFHHSQRQQKKMKAISWLLYLSGLIGMTFINPYCCVLAMKYANPSILAPFSGLTLVWVVLLSGWAVREHPGTSQKVACAFIILGQILVAVFGDHTNDEGKGYDDVVSRLLVWNHFGANSSHSKLFIASYNHSIVFH